MTQPKVTSNGWEGIPQANGESQGASSPPMQLLSPGGALPERSRGEKRSHFLLVLGLGPAAEVQLKLLTQGYLPPLLVFSPRVTRNLKARSVLQSREVLTFARFAEKAY